MASSVRYNELKSDLSDEFRLIEGIQYLTLEKVDGACYLIFKNTFPVTKGAKNFEVLMECLLNDVPTARDSEEGSKIAKRIADQLRIPFISKGRTVFTVVHNEKGYIPFEIIKGVAQQAGLIGSSSIDVTMKAKNDAKEKGSKFIEPKSIKIEKRVLA